MNLHKEHIKKHLYVVHLHYFIATEIAIIKRNIKWMKLETIILNEIIQPQKNKLHMFSFMCGE